MNFETIIASYRAILLLFPNANMLRRAKPLLKQPVTDSFSLVKDLDKRATLENISNEMKYNATNKTIHNVFLSLFLSLSLSVQFVAFWHDALMLPEL